MKRCVVIVGVQYGLLFGRSLLRSEMQQMERLLFEEFRGQQELDSERENRL
jgi:hypothetical protein